MGMITEIKKGDKFVCVKDVVMEHSGVIAYQAGKVYESEHSGMLTDEQGCDVHIWSRNVEKFFIPYDYNALREYFFNHVPLDNPEQTETLRKIWNLLGEIHTLQSRNWTDKHVHRLENSVTKGWTEAWMKDAEIAHKNKLDSGDCQVNCASCQCDPDVQHELEKEGIEHTDFDKTMADQMRISMEKTIKDMEDITGLKLTFPSSHAKVGDYVRCVKKLCPTGETRRFGVGGYRRILHIHNDVYYFKNEAFVSIKELDEHFVIDNSVVRDVLENTPTPDIQLPPYYNNDNGSLYKIAEQRGWNFYQADAVKRIDRALKKGQFKEDITKTIALLNLWLKENEL